MNILKEKNEQLREYVSATHMLCLLILILFLILHKKIISTEIYPAANIRYFLFLCILGFGIVFLYKTKTFPLLRDPKSLSWIDLGYIAIPLLFAVLILFTVGDSLPYVWATLFLPILITASILGKAAGLVMTTICSLVLVMHRVYFYLGVTQLHKLETELILISIMYVISWFVGSIANLKAEYQGILIQRLNIEECIASVSTKFINLAANEIDREINNTLEIISGLIGADLACFSLMFEAKAEMDNFYFWSAEKRQLPGEMRHRLSYMISPAYFEQLNRFETVIAPRVSGFSCLPDDDKNFLLSQEVKSFLILPIVYRKSLAGCLGFATLNKEEKWSEDIVSVLKTVGEILVNALARKQTEETLSLSEERFSKAFNASPYPMAIIKVKDKKIIDVNSNFLHAFGEVVKSKEIDQMVFNDPEILNLLLGAACKQEAIRNREVKFHRKSGKVIIGLLSAEVININREKCLLLAINDITEQRRLENEMSRLERLNLVGEMAAGLGHEIRNPMTTVRGFLQLLESKQEFKTYKEWIDIMISELDRTNTIISEFLSLAKNKAVNLKRQNLNAIVKALSPLIISDAIVGDKYIRLEIEDIPDLLLDEKEIRQLILNLSRNGLEAMSSQGVLTIKTYTEGKEVVLAIKDQGKGIEPQFIKKIGIPFFTTKDNGTGLGLAVCYSIAARHGAHIKVESSPNGTTFFVKFKVPQASSPA